MKYWRQWKGQKKKMFWLVIFVKKWVSISSNFNVFVLNGNWGNSNIQMTVWSRVILLKYMYNHNLMCKVCLLLHTECTIPRFRNLLRSKGMSDRQDDFEKLYYLKLEFYEEGKCELIQDFLGVFKSKWTHLKWNCH